MANVRDNALKAMKVKSLLPSFDDLPDDFNDYLKDAGEAGELVRDVEMIRRSTAVFITKDFIKLCRHAAQTIPDKMIRETDFFWENMTLVLEEPLTLVGDEGTEGNIKAMSFWLYWCSDSQCDDRHSLVCYWHTDKRDKNFSQFTPIPVSIILPTEIKEAGVLGLDSMVPYVIVKMMNQKIAVRTQGRPALPRQAVRQLERKGDVSDIVIVDLPQREYRRSEGEPGYVEWSHRWLSSGHWRRYEDGKVGWISESIKGPKDKPFIPKTIVGVADAR